MSRRKIMQKSMQKSMAGVNAALENLNRRCNQVAHRIGNFGRVVGKIMSAEPQHNDEELKAAELRTLATEMDNRAWFEAYEEGHNIPPWDLEKRAEEIRSKERFLYVLDSAEEEVL